MKVTRSGGNVYEDLGYSGEEAANLKVRSSLMIAITKIIRERGLTQGEAAELFGVPQPRISELVGGKIRLFSIDKLVAMLAHAEIEVDLVVTSRATRRRTPTKPQTISQAGA
jgi:predicted XRE-type DNA-binding protein